MLVDKTQPVNTQILFAFKKNPCFDHYIWLMVISLMCESRGGSRGLSPPHPAEFKFLLIYIIIFSKICHRRGSEVDRKPFASEDDPPWQTLIITVGPPWFLDRACCWPLIAMSEGSAGYMLWINLETTPSIPFFTYKYFQFSCSLHAKLGVS